ncbi:MAG: hypothetical protein ACJ79H_03565 [Myxococcales bacterium]
MSNTLTRGVTRVEFDQDIEEAVDEAGGIPEDAPWFCVRTDPWPCPAEGCDFVAYFMTAAHRIVVWPRKDDLSLLRQADMAAQGGRNPRVVEYEAAFGSCITYDVWVRIGRPVHGKIDAPEGYGARF